MRRYLVVAATLVAALVLPELAAAKGPASASVSGPGLDHSLTIRGDGEPGRGSSLGTLADASGFFPQMYGQSPDPTLRSEPDGTLGPRYRVVYVVPGPNSVKSRVVQHVYPYAQPSPLSHMSSGQSYWGSRKTLGGWFRGPVALKKVLVRAGLPRTAPPAGASSSRAGEIGGIAGVFALVTLFAVARSSRRRGWRPLRGTS
jgi:hypothetical protein